MFEETQHRNRGYAQAIQSDCTHDTQAANAQQQSCSRGAITNLLNQF